MRANKFDVENIVSYAKRYTAINYLRVYNYNYNYDAVGDNRRRLNDNAAKRPPAPKDSDRPLRGSWISRSQSPTSETTRRSGSDDGDSHWLTSQTLHKQCNLCKQRLPTFNIKLTVSSYS